MRKILFYFLSVIQNAFSKQQNTISFTVERKKLPRVKLKIDTNDTKFCYIYAPGEVETCNDICIKMRNSL
jgi:hypothetical protein